VVKKSTSVKHQGRPTGQVASYSNQRFGLRRILKTLTHRIDLHVIMMRYCMARVATTTITSSMCYYT